MALFLMFGVKHGPVVTAVILDLQRIGAYQKLGGANKGTQTALVARQLINDSLIIVL